MKNLNVLLYFGSRAISAAANLLSVAWFARLVGPSEYGAYILIFAWAIVIYGFASQWMKFAYFGIYRAAQESTIIASYARLVMVSICCVSGILLAVSPVLPASFSFILSLAALFASMTIYEGAVEVARTRLQVKTVAVSMIARAILVLVIGYIFLSLQRTAFILAIGVSVGHLIAALPALWMMLDYRKVRATRAAVSSLVNYGWPLILSFGVFAIGQTIDRFLVSHFVGNAILGPYGVIADMMRQTYMVVGESIALALITVAKRHADEGRPDESNTVMRSAFGACMITAVFGAAFFIVFGRGIATVLLGADFAAPAQNTIPFFAVGFGFMMLRSFYFAQVIYFASAALLELLIAVVFVVISAVLAFVLIPRNGAVGGAAALMVAQGAACLVSALVGRRLHVFPVDLGALIGMPVVAVALLVGCSLLATVIQHQAPLIAAQSALFTGVLLVTAWRFNLLTLVGIGQRRAPVAP